MQASHVKFSEFIEGAKTFVVPVYQRNYDWKVANCAKLFDDMIKSIEQNSPHFIGTIVHQKNSVDDIYQEYVIIDGQQRITSAILFARALCDVADDNLRGDIRSTFIVHTRGSRRGKCKLCPTEFDVPTFAKIIDGETNFTDDEKKSAMYTNFAYFRKAIADSKHSPDELQKALHKLNVVAICLDDESPQEIFESLNSTGLDLTQADLIRNFLLMPLAYDRQTELYKSYWLKIEELLRPSGNVENFITQYMITRRKSNAVKQEQLSKQKLYAPFKDFFWKNFGIDCTEDFLRELLRYAKFFRRCIFDESDDFNELPALEKKFYELTFLLKATNPPIILMYLFNRYERGDFDEATFIKFVDAMISLAFRSKVCGKSVITQQFAGNVLARLEKSLPTVDEFWKTITFGRGDRAFPSDATFRDALAGNELQDRLKSKDDFKYFLYALEHHNRTANLPAYSATVVEQILPQSPNADWKKYLATRNDSQAPELWSKNLGNLTLAENKVGAKDFFANKKARYAQSKFLCTRALANYSDWTSKQIQARAKRLAFDALKVWTLPEKFNEVVRRNESIFGLDSDFNTFTNTKPATILFSGSEKTISSWRDLLREIIKQLYALDKDIFRKATQQGNVRRSLFSTDAGNFQIDNDFYMKIDFDTASCLRYTKILTENFDALGDTNFKSEIWFTLRAE